MLTRAHTPVKDKDGCTRVSVSLRETLEEANAGSPQPPSVAASFCFKLAGTGSSHPRSAPASLTLRSVLLQYLQYYIHEMPLQYHSHEMRLADPVWTKAPSLPMATLTTPVVSTSARHPPDVLWM